MALTTTTLNGAVAVDQNTIQVTSATGFAAGSFVLVDKEVMKVVQSYVSGVVVPVLRGQEGTATAAHVSGANATAFLGSDDRGPGISGIVTHQLGRITEEVSYAASGAIELPKPGTDRRVQLIGTGALAMTLAVPTKDMDNCVLTIVANGKAAHTVTASGGFGANTTNSDVMTFHATQTTAIQCIASNGVWVLIGHVAGAATVAGAGLA